MAEPLGVASLDLLADRALTVRSDWKFVLRQAMVPELLRALSKTHLVLMADQARWGRYSSQYYDTPEQVCFHDHRRGKPRRFKVRHRDYLDRNLTMLEIKDRVPRGDTHRLRLWPEARGQGLPAQQDGPFYGLTNDRIPPRKGGRKKETSTVLQIRIKYPCKCRHVHGARRSLRC